MAYQYTTFNPDQSKMAQELLNMPINTLLNRYIKKKSVKPCKFFDAFKDEMNRIDSEEYLINPYLWTMAGPNTNFVATMVYNAASQLIKMGYEFKLENVARDLDKMFGEHKSLVIKISGDTPVQPISKDVSYFYLTSILTDRVIKSLENTSTLHVN